MIEKDILAVHIVSPYKGAVAYLKCIKIDVFSFY